MYTQCPDCSTAFRVTAEVLKQAAGKVRCGSCRHAFNALEYLSETRPDPAPIREAEESLPELKPDPAENDAGLPASISAEQSAALLKTLDELAGSDIRIEDTGVEWRVFDGDEQGDSAVDELLEESPTPVDEFLTETPTAVDEPDVFAEAANTLASTPVDELRFDDNTPLPDNFEFGGAPPEAPVTGDAGDEEYAEEADAPAEPDAEPQTDLDLSEPDEWTDILDEFEDLAEAVAAPIEADGNLPDEASADAEDAFPDDPASETDVATAVAGSDHEPHSDADEPLDMDAQFALQAEALGIDLSGIHEAPESEDIDDADEDLDIDALLEEADEDDRDIDELLDEESVDEADEETVVEDLFAEDFLDEADTAEELQEAAPLGDDDEHEDEDAFGEAAQLELIDKDIADAEPDDDVEDRDVTDSAADDEGERIDEHYVPPMSEEEQTINMMIDQDLMALAVPDDDGFASTIVIPEENAETAVEKEETKSAKEKDPLKETGAGFETIIMEGEHIRSDLDQEKLAADAAAAASLAGAAAAEREAEQENLDGRKRLGYIAGIVLLALLLGAQAVHQSRDRLATNATFNDLVGPVYRAIGKPLSPDWDITGWRFEATKGSTDDTDQELTIYSRIGNTSKRPLPYPLVGISLTDRFEETIGSRILDPGEYLSNDLDPRKLVQPGNTFNAVISIQSPAEEATGFKLNVCYRESGGQLRCALNDFK